MDKPNWANQTIFTGDNIRRAGAAIIALLAVLGGAVVSTAAAAQEAATEDVEVRIVARKLDSGRVEFGLQQRQSDDTWGERRLPRVRFFPTTATVDRWLASSTLDLPVGEVRIVARKLDDGRVEFGLQQRQSDDTWGDRQLPRVRFFPTTATVNRWLASSPFTLTAPQAGIRYTAVTCVDVPAHDGDRWCTPPVVGDTIQLFSDWGGLGTDGLDPLRLRRLRPHPLHTTADGPTTKARGVCRMSPLALRVGMVIEDYDTGRPAVSGAPRDRHRRRTVGAPPPSGPTSSTPSTCARGTGASSPATRSTGSSPARARPRLCASPGGTATGSWRLLISPAMILVGGGC